MAETAAMPSLEEARGWIGAKLADRDGDGVGEVHCVYVDEPSRNPVWLIVRIGRRRRPRLVAVPLRECAGAPFGVWVAEEVETIRHAPVVDPTRPLRREHELAIGAHYDIGDSVGRPAEVSGRAEGEVTATPVAA